MPTGRPSSAGTSNDSMARTNRISKVAAIAGQVSFNVMCQAICGTLAPLIMADSSSDGSIERNAALITRNAIDE